MRKAKIGIPIMMSIFIFSTSHLSYALRLKKTIAVSRFENKTNYVGQIRLGDAMADQLTDALIKTGKFVVLERQTLSDVISEQDLAASSRASKSRTARIGRITPAQILIKGTITEFEEETQSGDMGISYKGISVGTRSSSAHVAVILRIIDSTTGEVINSVRVEGKAKAGGLSLGVSRSVSIGMSGFKKTPLGKALQIAIDKAVIEICKSLENIPFTGRIVKVSEDGKIFTNIGARNGAKVGDTFEV